MQAEEGYVTRTGVRFCSEMLGLTTAEVTAVSTFYTMYRRKPSGDYQVKWVINNRLVDTGDHFAYAYLK